jgi:hypothetical protein
VLPFGLLHFGYRGKAPVGMGNEIIAIAKLYDISPWLLPQVRNSLVITNLHLETGLSIISLTET